MPNLNCFFSLLVPSTVCLYHFSTEQAFGEEMLDFHAPILQDLPFPPVKINFQKDFFCDGKIGDSTHCQYTYTCVTLINEFSLKNTAGSGTEGKVYKCRSHFIGFDETSVAVKEVLCLDYPQ